jgi:hypothetical protein
MTTFFPPRQSARRATGALLFALCGPAPAAPPLITDDASILPAGYCQLELRARGQEHQGLQYAQVSCDPGGSVEWALSLAHAKHEEAPTQVLATLQGKTVLASGDAWGTALRGALANDLRHGDPATTLLATLIGTIAPSPTTAADLNVGLAQSSGDHAVPNWGAAFEAGVGERWTLLAERYGERGGRPATQLGARTWLRPSVLQLDATVGQDASAGHYRHYVTLGLVWAWDARSRGR